MRKAKYLILVLLILAMSNCATMLNPYENGFKCPKTQNGKCITVEEAYNESLQSSKKLKNKKTNNSLEAEYKKTIYKEWTSTLKLPKKPIITSPDLMYVVILPYKETNNNILYMHREIFMMLDKPKFVLEDRTQTSQKRGE